MIKVAIEIAKNKINSIIVQESADTERQKLRYRGQASRGLKNKMRVCELPCTNLQAHSMCIHTPRASV
jgi:hypothetical protein